MERFITTRSVIFFLFICFLNTNHAQINVKSSGAKIGVLSGTVTDSITKLPIEYASIKIYNEKDSSVAGAIYTNNFGDFILDQIVVGRYYVKVFATNYQFKVIRDVSFSIDKTDRSLGMIRLVSKVKELKEIVITSNKKMLETSFDKKVYNLADDISARGGSVVDALSNVPSVEVDQDGKLSMRGSGNVTVLIDGRPSTLARDGGSFLSGIPANMVDRVEIVTNPSAKYDPDGTTGIINIVLKKNKLKGINGNVNLSGATGNLFNGSASLSYRAAKLNAYGTYSYKHYEGERNNFGLLNRTIDNQLFRLKQDRLGTDYNVTHTIKIGSDFYLKDRNTLGISFTGNLGERNRTGNLINNQLDSNNNMLYSWYRDSYDPSKQKSMDLNVNYKWDFKEDKGYVNFDVTQSVSMDTTGGNYNQSNIDLNRKNLLQQLSNDENGNVNTAMFDLVRVLPKNIKMEAGLKSIYRINNIRSHSQTLDTIIGEYMGDTLSNFQYRYTEQIFSSYVNFAQQLTKFKYQFGLRIEESNQTPNLISKNLEFPKNYFNLYPSAFLTYKIKENIDLNANYSRRINRPSSETLNPFTSYADPYNLRMGNPAVNPEFIHSFELGLGISKKKVQISANIFFKQTSNVLQRYRQFYSNGYAAVTYVNIDKSESLGSELVITFRPVPAWKNTISFNGNQIKYFDDVIQLTNDVGYNWSTKYIGSIEFWKRTATLQVNAKYNAPIVTPQGTVQPRASVDVSGEKSFKEGNWSVGFKISDVFNTQEFRIDLNQYNIQQESVFKQTTRRFYLNLAYKFGKMEVTKKGKVSNDNNGGGGDF
jgi:outer membrane receptor protein involved in Fe transport